MTKDLVLQRFMVLPQPIPVQPCRVERVRIHNHYAEHRAPTVRFCYLHSSGHSDRDCSKRVPTLLGYAGLDVTHMVKELDISKFLTAKRESRHIEFKEGFNPSEAQDWCEIIKDIVAMANSGGGCILFGVNKRGLPSGWDRSQLCLLDPAQITDKIASYTSEQFSEFDVQEGST